MPLALNTTTTAVPLVAASVKDVADAEPAGTAAADAPAKLTAAKVDATSAAMLTVDDVAAVFLKYISTLLPAVRLLTFRVTVAPNEPVIAYSVIVDASIVDVVGDVEEEFPLVIDAMVGVTIVGEVENTIFVLVVPVVPVAEVK